MRRLVLLISSILVIFATTSTPALSQQKDWPTKPVRFVVPFPPGGVTDVVARIVARDVAEIIGQPIVIENKTGAGGIIGAEYVAKSPPDGYTLLFAANTQYVANVSLFKNLPYDPLRDFSPIARTSAGTIVLLVRTDFPARNLAEFIAYVKAHPKKLSAGYGASTAQVAIALLRKLTQIDVTEVPYKGIPQAVTDLLGGTLDFTFGDIGSAIGHVQGGRLRAIAVTSLNRSPVVPDWPTAAETISGFELMGWQALAAPAGTPRHIVLKLSDAIAKTMARPSVIEALAKQGLDAAPLGPDELAAYMRVEIARWAELVKDAGIKPE